MRLFFYIAYMASISLYNETWLTTIWFIVHLTSWVIFHFYGGKAMVSKLNCKESLFYWAINPWNIVDFARITLLGIMVTLMIWTDLYSTNDDASAETSGVNIAAEINEAIGEL
jgi:hypothetical protein